MKDSRRRVLQEAGLFLSAAVLVLLIDKTPVLEPIVAYAVAGTTDVLHRYAFSHVWRFDDAAYFAVFVSLVFGVFLSLRASWRRWGVPRPSEAVVFVVFALGLVAAAPTIGAWAGGVGAAPAAGSQTTVPGIDPQTATTTEPTQKISEWSADGEVLESVTVARDEYGYLNVRPELRPHDGHVLMYVSPRLWGPHKQVRVATNETNRVVHPGDRVDIYHVDGDDRRLIARGDVREDDVEWSIDESVPDVTDAEIENEAANVRVSVRNLTNTSVLLHYRFEVTSDKVNGTVVVERWDAGEDPRHPEWAYTAPVNVIATENSTFRAYYVRGDERRLLTTFTPG